MRRFVIFLGMLLCIISLSACQDDGTMDNPELIEIPDYTYEELEDRLIGVYRDDLLYQWGEPDFTLSGFFGDGWYFDDEHSQSIILYYDENEFVTDVNITDSD